MRAADEATIAGGTSGAVLMDRAAYACAVVALRMLGGAYGKRVVVVVGKGNNGGDGLVCASHLRDRGVVVSVVTTEEWSRARFDGAVKNADLVIDAVLGPGFAGEPKDVVGAAIEAIASCNRPVLSIDIPSGVSGADGQVPGVAVDADVTVAIQALKCGHVSMPGALRCGRVDVADIGIALQDVDTFVTTARDVRAVLPDRDAETHKYKVGALGVLAGSAGMTGAAILTAHGAIRSGAGLVILGVPASTIAVFEGAVIEAIKVPLPDAEGQLEAKAVDEFADRLERCRALAIGPGLGRGPRAVAVVRRALDVGLPMVIDGDGLWALAEVMKEEPDVLHNRGHATVLTPHSGEYAFLAGRPARADRVADVREAAERWGAVVHLKGRRPITAAPSGTVWVNTSGNPGLATGGTGDVLTGVVGSLLAQGVMPEPAAWAGAYLHGMSADLVAGRLGEASLRATDLTEALGRALSDVARATPNVGRLRTVLSP